VVAAVCVSAVVLAIVVMGRGVETVDVRTYVEMTRGVALHGLPYLDNGPVDRFAPLCVPWGVFSRGHVWGIYGPVYAYFGAPFVALGGVRLLTIATCSLVVPIAIMTFLLARRVVGDERHAALATVMTTIGTPVLAKSLEATAFPLAVLFAVAATHAAVTAISSRGKKRLAFAALAGSLSAIASVSHLLDVPNAAANLGVLAVVDVERKEGVAFLRTLLPTRAKLATFAAALAAFLVSIAPAALLNELRFGTLNPYSYGPVPWRGTVPGTTDMTIGGHLSYAKPVLVLAAFVALALVATSFMPRGRQAARGLVVVLAVAALALLPELREKTLRYLATASSFIVTTVDLESPGYAKPPGGIAVIAVGWVVKSTLQCSPFLALVFALRALSPARRSLVLVTLAPACALYTYLLLRGNMPRPAALGFPAVYLRYTLPALPMLSVVAVLAVRSLDLGRREVVIGIATAVAFASLLFGNDRDVPVFRQVLLLVVPIVVAAGALVAMELHRRGLVGKNHAAAAAAIVFGLGIAIGVAHDLRVSVIVKKGGNAHLERIAPLLPERFALFGHLDRIDNILSLRAERDIEYADLHQTTDYGPHMRPLLEHWFAEGRPVFYACREHEAQSWWPDVTFEPLSTTDCFMRVKPRER
jgi:hypothetical protein